MPLVRIEQSRSGETKKAGGNVAERKKIEKRTIMTGRGEREGERERGERRRQREGR